MRKINLLFSKTKELISKRRKNQVNSSDFYSNLDSRFIASEISIELAIEGFLNEKTRRDRVLSFNKKIKDIFESYRKTIYPDYFNKFIECEELLENILPKHIAHYDHVIEVFLLGYNILTNWNYILDKSKKFQNDNFFKLDSIFFSWLVASYFHDYGYIIEKFHEFLNQLSKKLVTFSEFDIPSFAINPIKIKYENPIAKKYFTFVYNLYENLPNATKLKKTEFENLFLIIKDNWEQNKNGVIINRESYPLDHGIVSAITYLKILDLAEKEYKQKGISPLKFKTWNANQNAILGIALHNFWQINIKKLKKLNLLKSGCELNLSSRDDKSLIAYLLIVCDSIHNWERNDKKKNKSKKELENIFIDKNQMFLQINHKLNNNINVLKYLTDFLEDLIKLKEKLPFKIEVDNIENSNEELFIILEDLNNLKENTSILNVPLTKDSFLISVKHTILNNRINIEINL